MFRCCRRVEGLFKAAVLCGAGEAGCPVVIGNVSGNGGRVYAVIPLDRESAASLKDAVVNVC